MRPASLAAALAAAALAACGTGELPADPGRRASAVRALADGDRGLAVLLVAARDPSPLVRAAAADAFAARGGPAAAEALGKLVVDPSPEVAGAAARGLGGMGKEPRARASLLEAYADATGAGRAAIADALERLGVSLREAVEREARLRWVRNVAALGAPRDSARVGAAEELGASGRAEAVQRLLPLADPARSPDHALAAAAARGLGEAGDWGVRPALEALLDDSGAELAEAAAEALGRLGDPRAADALAGAGTAGTGRIAAAAVDALAALPDAQEVGVALCDVAIKTGDPAVAARAAREARRRDAACPDRPLLAKMNRPGAAAALAALAELGPVRDAAAIAALLDRSPDVDVRIAAARVLARGGGAAAAAVSRRLGALEGRIAERRARAEAAPGRSDAAAVEQVREAAGLLAAAGALRIAELRPALLPHARDPDGVLRAGAVEGLSRLGGTESLAPVAAALADGDPAVRLAAAEGLGRMGASGVAALSAAARDGTAASPEWRDALARALGETGSADAIPALTALLEGRSASAAAAALSRIGAPAAAAPLVAYLGRGGAPARVDVVEALAQLAARDAAPAIAALLTDDRPEVRAAAARALGRLGHEPAAARLEALRSDYDGRVRRAAVEALAKLPSGGPRARR